MLETSELFLKDFVFAAKTRNEDGPGKYRHTVEALRSVCWFHALRIRTAAGSTYAMEKMLDPTSFGTTTGGKDFYRNKWRTYREGLHSPKAVLVRRVEDLYPGTQILFDHVLWDVLRPRLAATIHAHAWLGRLSSRVAKVIANPKSRTREGGLQEGTLSRLQRIADLDAMACVIVFLRLAMESQQGTRDTFHLTQALCRMVIMSGAFLYTHGIAVPFAEYLDLFLLSRQSTQRKHVMQAEDFLQRAYKATRIVRNMEGNENKLFSRAEKNDVILGLMKGHYGDAIQAAVEPLSILNATL